jgi:hypothetical protein
MPNSEKDGPPAGLFLILAWLATLALCCSKLGAAEPARQASAPAKPANVQFINTSFENASPLFWVTQNDGTVLVHLLYDQERNSPNRAAGHWLFQVEGTKGAEVSLVLTNFDNVWNGTKGSPISTNTHCYLSEDGRSWKVVDASKTASNTLQIQLKMSGESVYVARLEPYRLSDLERFKEEIRKRRFIRIEAIGRTVEGRKLEIIRAGRPEARARVFLRARAHAWEPGGNWVVQGMIEALLENTAEAAKLREQLCLYVMPLANKDGVARGHTRFNSLGMDLNRNWHQPADPQLAPENHALEQWLAAAIKQGQAPHLAIDLHNDNNGKLHLSRPDIAGLPAYLERMKRLEELLKRHTWFREGSTGGTFRNPGSIGEGLLERYGIDAVILELNCDWIQGLQKPPEGKDWELLGRQMLRVFAEFFAGT